MARADLKDHGNQIRNFADRDLPGIGATLLKDWEIHQDNPEVTRVLDIIRYPRGEIELDGVAEIVDETEKVALDAPDLIRPNPLNLRLAQIQS